MEQVDCFCASLWRQGHVINSVNTLRQQPEFGTAHITCNNWTDEQWQYINAELGTDDRIFLHRHDNEKGSNEKLRYLSQGSNNFICLFDDDLLYPDDYLMKMISGSTLYNAYVSLHGVILAQRPIRSYYRDRQVFRGLGTVLFDQEVDIASNCGSVFQRQFYPKGEIESWYDRCTEISCDDIWTNMWSKKCGVIRMVLKHREGYLKHKTQYESDDYCFNKYTKQLGITDTFQTKLINTQWDK